MSIQNEAERIRLLRVVARMNKGGPASLITELMNNLDSRRFEQILVTGQCKNGETEVSLSFRGEVIKLKSLGREVQAFSDLISLYKLHKIIAKKQPNIIVTHTFKAGFLVRLVILLRILARRRIDVVVVHNYHGHLLRGYFNGYSTRIYIWLERLLSTVTDFFIFDGSKVKDDLIECGVITENNYAVVIPGVQNPKATQEPNFLGDVRRRDSIKIGYVGRLVDVKRPDIFLDVAQELSSRDLLVDFVIVGEGPLRDKIYQEVSKRNLNIELRPFFEDTYEALREIDILVLCSDNEGTPLMLMYSSFLGIPSVATNVGSVRDTVCEGVNGFLVSQDSQEIADKIQMLITDSERLSRISKSCLSFAEHNFKISRYVAKHQEIYLELVTVKTTGSKL